MQNERFNSASFPIDFRYQLYRLCLVFVNPANIFYHNTWYIIHCTFSTTFALMPVGNETAENIAEQLLQIKAIKLQPSQPFTWASGWKSPIYCDNRISLSHPRVRTYIRQALVKMIGEKYGKPDVIAGVATAA